MLRHLIRRIHCSRALQSVEIPLAPSEPVNTPPTNIPLLDNTFNLHAAGILVRQPLCLRPLSEFESAYESYRHALQAEYSRGEFEIMTDHKREMAQLQGESRGEAAAGMVPEYSLPDTYKAAEEKMESLMRRLDRKLYMVVKNELDSWQFPSVHVRYADVALHKHVGDLFRKLLGEECELYHVGNSPVSYHLESLPDRVSPPMGIKTFFFRSQLVSGKLLFNSNQTARSYAWLTMEELKEALPSAYYDSVSSVLSY